MLAKRIIACLDIKDGRTVKGVNFLELRDAGDPVELGKIYSDQGIDELVFLDITATHEKRKTLGDLARAVAKNLNIPFTIGGGVSSLADASVLLEAGADKISINSAAVRNPQLVRDLALEFGSQFVVVAIDGRQTPAGWEDVRVGKKNRRFGRRRNIIYLHGSRWGQNRLCCASHPTDVRDGEYPDHCQWGSRDNGTF